MFPHPAAAIFRAIVDELLLTEANWRVISLEDVKARFDLRVLARRQRQAI